MKGYYSLFNGKYNTNSHQRTKIEALKMLKSNENLKYY